MDPELFYRDDSGNITQLTPAPATNPEFTYTAGENIDAGELVAMDYDGVNTEPRVYKADANSGTTELNRPVGIATNTATTGNPVTVQTSGETAVIPDAEWTSVPAATAVGSLVYMQNTAGSLNTSAPAGPTTVRVVGVLTQGGTGACKIAVNIGDGIGII